MKKLKLSLQNIEGAEVLTREQLKKVTGGSDGSGDCATWNCECFDMPGTWSGYYCDGGFGAIRDYCRYGGYCAS